MFPYLITYDIADPRRLVRLHRYLAGEALALQYSVFFGSFIPAAIDRIEDEIAAHIDPKEDDVRIYPLPADFQVWALGASAPLPEGIHFAPAERLLAAAEAPVVEGGQPSTASSSSGRRPRAMRPSPRGSPCIDCIGDRAGAVLCPAASLPLAPGSRPFAIVGSVAAAGAAGDGPCAR